MGILGATVAVGVAVGSGVEVGLGVKVGNWIGTLVKVGSVCKEDAGAGKLHPTSESSMERANIETAQRNSGWLEKMFFGRSTDLVHAPPGDHTGAVEFIPF